MDRDQCADQQHPADQQAPLADESPPRGEIGTDDERAEDAQDSQHDKSENMGSANFLRRHLHSSREANTDAEHDRRKDIDQAADDQAHAEAWRRRIEDSLRRNRCLLRLWLMRWRAKPPRRTGRGELAWLLAKRGAHSYRLVGSWMGSNYCRTPANGGPDRPAGRCRPMHGSPCRIGGHRAGHHSKRFLRVAGLITNRRDQASQWPHRS
jgi:hypothetical protein